MEYKEVNAIDFVIPLDPKTKKNSARIIYKNGRPIIIPSKTYCQYEKDVLRVMSGYWNQFLPIDEPVNVKALYYRKTKHRVDLPNLNNALHDIMVKHGFIVDDNSKIIVSTDGSRVYHDNKNPRTEVVITKLEV